MKVASISEIKNEIENIPAKELKLLCLRLAKFKKENKELLTYLLFESNDPDTYLKNVKEEIDLGFEDLPKPNIYWTKKALRKILRSLSKYIKYIGSTEAEIEILLHFTTTLKQSSIPYKRTAALSNIYDSQVKKIKKAIESLHEDLQFDYSRMLAELES